MARGATICRARNAGGIGGLLAIEQAEVGGGADEGGVDANRFTVGYDGNGNVTQLVDWNALDIPTASAILEPAPLRHASPRGNRLTAVVPLAPVQGETQRLEFEYDHQGRRIEKRVFDWDGSQWGEDLAARRRYVWSGWLMLIELDRNPSGGTNRALRKLTWGLDRAGQAGAVNSLEQAGGIGVSLANSATGGVNASPGSVAASAGSVGVSPAGSDTGSAGVSSAGSDTGSAGVSPANLNSLEHAGGIGGLLALHDADAAGETTPRRTLAPVPNVAAVASHPAPPRLLRASIPVANPATDEFMDDPGRESARGRLL